MVGVGDAVGGGDGPAVVAVVHLVPPAVEDRQVEAAVERRLHAGRAAGLERAQRVVEPHVAARVERLRHRDVVVGQEHDAVAHGRVVGEPHQLLDQLLAAVVGGVRLARDDELHRPLGVQQDRLEPLGVAQHQRQSLVRRDAAGEADGEHVRVEHLVDPAQLGLAGAPLLPRRAPGRGRRSPGRPRSTPRTSQIRSSGTRSMPSQPWASSTSSVPTSCAARANTSGATQVGACTPLVTEVIGTSGASKPGHSPANMLAADLAVQLGDAVGALGQAQAHDGHVEDAGVAALVVLGAEREERVDGHAGQALSPPKCCAMRSRGNRSMPAGTGVWVVNTVAARAASSAVVEGRARRPR